MIIYSSKTNNTKKLAEFIADKTAQKCYSIEQIDKIHGGKLRFNLPSDETIKAHGNQDGLIYFGFWVDKGQIDEVASSFLPYLKGKNVALFYTAGVEHEHEYVKTMNEQFVDKVKEMGANVLGIFHSQGAISDEVIEFSKNLAKTNPTYVITEEKKARWSESKKHPNEADFARLSEFIKSIQGEKMDKNLEFALKHMNEDHKANLFDLVKYHKNIDAKEVELIELSYEAMVIKYDGENTLKLEFSQKANEKTLEYAVVSLCMQAKGGKDMGKIDAEISEFKNTFKSVIISSISPSGKAIASYAPVIFDNDDIYIFISEVAEHFAALKTNANLAEIMFIEDEKTAKNIFARKRLRYSVNATILERGVEFDRLFALMKKQQNAHVDMFYAIEDFHFVKLEITGGRFVKGFGAAYAIDENGKANTININHPHRMKK